MNIGVISMIITLLIIFLCIIVFDSFKEAIRAGKLLPEEVKMLHYGLQEVADLDAIRNYGYPSVRRWLKEDCFTLLK